MPIYEYKCEFCQVVEDKKLPVDERDQVQKCASCGKDAYRIISLCGFVLKGDGWPGKNMRIKGQMTQKNKRLTQKQNEMKRDAPPVTLAPNVGGERVDTWAEAQKLAASEGKDTTSYDPYVAKEKSGEV